MNTEERIKRYGLAAHNKHKQQTNTWHRNWRKENPKKLKVNNHELSRKGGKYYNTKLKWRQKGIQHKKYLIRTKHAHRYQRFKKIIAPESQIHHEWIPNTANYRGIALVETDQHMHGFIDVIEILEGEITLLTEAEIREDKY